MRHPFDGVIETDGAEDERSSRRGILRKAAAVGGAAVLVTVGDLFGKAKPKKKKKNNKDKAKDKAKKAKEAAARKAELAKRKKIAEECGQAAGQAMKDGKLNEAFKKLIAMERIAPDDKTKKVFLGLARKFSDVAKQAAVKADQQFAGGQHADAIRTYLTVSKFGKIEAARMAQKGLAKAKKHPGYRDACNEIKAAELFEQAELLQEHQAEAKTEAQKRVIQRKIFSILLTIKARYPKTPAGEKAIKLLDELRAKT